MSLRSIGVTAIAIAECHELDLPVIPDAKPYPEHVSIDFSALKSQSQKEAKAKLLRAVASARGWQYGPV